MLSACSSMLHPASSTTAAKPAVAPNPTAANYNVQLGVGYLQQGDMQQAKSKLLLAIAQAPTSAPARDAMAYYLENTGDPKSAEQYYQQAINLDAKSGSAQNNYGAFLCREGRYPEADQHFMLAVQDPNYLNTAEVYENAGLCIMQVPDNAKAMSYFQKAIQADPNRAASYLELAQLYFNQANYPVAQQYFDHYAALMPNMTPEGLWLGVRLARQVGDNSTAGSYALTLQSKFAGSNEYKQLMASNKPQVKNP